MSFCAHPLLVSKSTNEFEEFNELYTGIFFWPLLVLIFYSHFGQDESLLYLTYAHSKIYGRVLDQLNELEVRQPSRGFFDPLSDSIIFHFSLAKCLVNSFKKGHVFLEEQIDLQIPQLFNAESFPCAIYVMHRQNMLVYNTLKPL